MYKTGAIPLPRFAKNLIDLPKRRRLQRKDCCTLSDRAEIVAPSTPHCVIVRPMNSIIAALALSISRLTVPTGISPHGMSPPLRLPTNRWPNGAPGSINCWRRTFSLAGYAPARRPRSRQGVLRNMSRRHPALAHGRNLGHGVTSAPAYEVR